MITTSLAALTAVAIAPAVAMAAPSPLVDDTMVDFAGGTLGSSTWAVEPGSVRLKPGEAAANFDSGLGDWTATQWTTGTGSGDAAAGTLTLDGARAHGTPTYAPPRVLEFRATFANEAFQHVGLGDTLGNGNEPWAIFSTGADGVSLYARSQNATDPAPQSAPITVTDPFGPHVFRIEWSATAVRYFVDGALVAEHTVNHTGVSLRPIASDATPGATPADAKVLKVDWIGMSPAATGTFESRPLEADDARTVWGSLTQAPSGMAIETRTGNSAASMSAYQPLGAGGAIQSPAGKLIQYKATLTSAAPSLDRVEIPYTVDTVAPTASIDSVAVIGTTAKITFSRGADDVAGFECSLDGGAFAPCASPKEFTGLAAGAHTVAVRAIDNVGNAGDAVSKAFTVSSPAGSGNPPKGGGTPSSVGGTTPDTTKPAIAIARNSVRASRKGVVKVRVSCPATEERCMVKLKLKDGRKIAARKSVTIDGGATMKVKLQLKQAARKRLAKRGRLNVKAIATALDDAGNSKRVQRHITLRS